MLVVAVGAATFVLILAAIQQALGLPVAQSIGGLLGVTGIGVGVATARFGRRRRS